VPLYGVFAYNKRHKTVEMYAFGYAELTFYAKKAVFGYAELTFCLWLWATTPDNGSAHKELPTSYLIFPTFYVLLNIPYFLLSTSYFQLNIFKKMTCIIVEDEPLAAERIAIYIKKLPFLSLLATFDNAQDALIFLKTNTVELLFLDINLNNSGGELSGIQLLETANITSQVIMTTAYHEYAIKGFDLKVADYLLKPYTFERFLQAVERVQAHFINIENKDKNAISTITRNFIFIKVEYRLEKVFLDDILYIEGMGDYRCIHTLEKRLLTQQTFSDFEKELPASLICRVHKSYMVAIAKINSIERDRIHINGVSIPISETYKQAFFMQL
jgi:two-component system, LytTR family, response regulator